MLPGVKSAHSSERTLLTHLEKSKSAISLKIRRQICSIQSTATRRSYAAGHESLVQDALERVQVNSSGISEDISDHEISWAIYIQEIGKSAPFMGKS